MSLDLMSSILPILTAALVAAVFLWAVNDQSYPACLFIRYCSRWNRMLKFSYVDPRMKSVPRRQIITVLLLLVAAVGFRQPYCLVFALIVAAAPYWLLIRHQKKRIKMLEAGLDAFLTALADSLTTVPNLTEALQSQIELIEPPIKEEVVSVLAEVRLGRSLDDALKQMAARLALPGLDAAVGAALLGKRTGGDLPVILRRIAETIREMSRLEGVIRTKTAEGRSQAWVMGSVPPGLMLILEKVDSNWLAPLWNDPIGWIMLGCAAVLEVSAVALIRKIMAVDI